MKRQKSLEEWASHLIIPLYQGQYLHTLWNAWKSINRERGWILKNKMWSPWFFNMRPFGNSPQLFCDTSMAMADLIASHDDIDVLIGVEMAGVPLVGAVAIASLLNNGIERRICYSRPLPQKARTPLEALEILREIEISQAFYGEKNFVEARLMDGDRIGIFDDMSTDLGSKLISRLTVLWQASQLPDPVKVTCNKIFYTLNRDPANRQKGIEFANNPELGLFPEALDVYYLIEVDEHFSELQKVMRPGEYRVFSEYQKHPEHFKDKRVQTEVLALAAKAA